MMVSCILRSDVHDTELDPEQVEGKWRKIMEKS